jgi:hypothetical protein
MDLSGFFVFISRRFKKIAADISFLKKLCVYLRNQRETICETFSRRFKMISAEKISFLRLA